MSIYISNFSDNRKYTYAYDDKSGQVLLGTLDSLKNAGVEISGSISMGEFQKCSGDWAKLRLIGAEPINLSGDLYFHLCDYHVGELRITLSIMIRDNTTAEMLVSIRCRLGSVNYYMVHVSYEVLNVLPVCSFVTGDGFKLEILDKMVWWLLNLYSNRDFNGIMDSFDNLLGTRLDFILGDLSSTTISCVEWR